MSDLRKVWLESFNGKIDEKEMNLLDRASLTIQNNVYEGGEYPWSPYRCISPGINHFNGIWNWDSAFHAMAVSRWDTQLARESILGFTQFQHDDGLFPDLIYTNGEISSVCSKPPVMAWAAEIVYDREPNKEFLDTVYSQLKKNEEYWCSNRFDRGLFFYDAVEKNDGNRELYGRYESGLDDSIRWDKPVMNYWAIDLNCYMIMFYRSLSSFAKILMLGEESIKWDKKAEQLESLINEVLWNDEMKCYVDVDRFSGEKSPILTPASFMPLFIEIASEERAEWLNKLAMDPNKFYSGMPTVAYDDPEYSRTYWRGPTWLNIAYFAAKGLKNYGFKSADKIKETILNWVANEKRGIFENYDSKNGDGLYCDHFSWSSAFVIEFILNF